MLHQTEDMEPVNQAEDVLNKIMRLNKRIKVRYVHTILIVQKNLDQEFQKRYGKTKTELLDSWLEMDASSIQEECNRMGVKSTNKHIENI